MKARGHLNKLNFDEDFGPINLEKNLKKLAMYEAPEFNALTREVIIKMTNHLEWLNILYDCYPEIKFKSMNIQGMSLNDMSRKKVSEIGNLKLSYYPLKELSEIANEMHLVNCQS